MEKLLLVGAGGLGRVVHEHVSNKYACAFVDDAKEEGINIDGCSVIGTTSDLEVLFDDYKKLVVTIGNNALRESLYSRAKKIGFEFPNIIVPSAYISPYAIIGEGCIILNNVVVQNGSQIGNGVILNPGVEIHHDSMVGNYVLIYTNSVVRTMARIGDRAHIGSTLTISNGVNVQKDAIIVNGRTLV